MTEYDYVNARLAHALRIEALEPKQRNRIPGQRRRRPGGRKWRLVI
jgi:hypothetical protein